MRISVPQFGRLRWMPAGMVMVVLTLAAQAQPALKTAPVQKLELPRNLVLTGTVEPVDQSTVSAQTSGRVQQILADVNDYVKQGSVIVRLRDADQQAALEQAQAGQEEAQAQLSEAQAAFQRINNLFRRKISSQADYDAARAKLQAAQAQLQASQARVKSAQEELDKTVIRAPYSGIVRQRFISLGESVQPGAPLLSGFSLDHLRVVADVPQRQIAAVRAQADAHVLLPDGKRIAATGLTFFPYADPQSNVFKVRVNLPPKLAGIYPGMFLKVAFVEGKSARLVIPQQALVQRSELSAVYVVGKQGRVEFRQVRVGEALPDARLEILAGLDPGERVAVEPLAAARELHRQQTAEAPQ